MEAAKIVDPMLGTEVGRYRLERVIGAGGMGRVYLGVQPAIGARVAIKILSGDVLDDADLVARFFTEARAANVIHHDNIVRVLDLDRLPDGRPYIVMELIDGVTLRELLARGPMPIGGVIRALTEVLLALHAAHQAGIVHRDLKPDNVMITATGHAKVLDFGVAKLVHPIAPRTVTGVAVGTPYYMAPEQINGEPVSARTDVYAAGCVLFELLTSSRPFDGATDFQVMTAHVSSPPPSVRALRAGIPDALDEIIRQALAKRPDDRFATAKAMAHALQHVAGLLPDGELRPLVTSAHWLPPDPNATAPTPPPVVASRATVVGSGKARKPRAGDRRRAYKLVAAVAFAGGATAAIVIATRGHDAATPTPVVVATTPADAAPPIVVTAPGPDEPMFTLGGENGTMTVGKNGSVTITGAAPPVPKAKIKPGEKIPPPADTKADPGKADPAKAPEPTKGGDDAEYDERTDRKIGKKADFDPTKLDALAYLPKAIAFVHQLAPQAQLDSFEIRGVGSSGRADFTAVSSGGAKYSFTSPVKPCQLAVILSEERAITWIDEDDTGCGKGHRKPSCTMAQIYARAAAAQIIFKDERTRIDWTGTDWEVMPDEGGIEHLDDDCSNAVAAGTVRDAPVEKVEPEGFDFNKRTFEKPYTSMKGFDPKTYASTARALARQLEPDAELTELDVRASADGATVDLPVFYYRSAKAIASPDPDRINCIAVDVQPWGEQIVRVGRAARACERDRVIHAPRCTVAQLMARLTDQPTKATNIVLDDRGWRVMGGGVDETLSDDCK